MDTTNIPYHYPLRESAWVLAFRVVVLQIIIGLLSLVANMAISLVVTQQNSLITPLTAYGLSSIIIQTIDAVMLLVIILRWANTTFLITPDNIVVKRGVLSLRHTDYRTQRVESVNVQQNIWGRLFNYGTIKFYSPVLKEEVYLTNIPDPVLYAEVIRRTESKDQIQFLPRRSESAHEGNKH